MREYCCQDAGKEDHLRPSERTGLDVIHSNDWRQNTLWSSTLRIAGDIGDRSFQTSKRTGTDAQNRVPGHGEGEGYNSGPCMGTYTALDVIIKRQHSSHLPSPLPTVPQKWSVPDPWTVWKSTPTKARTAIGKNHDGTTSQSRFCRV